MSDTHPVVAITGSSGAGTTTVTDTFAQIFARESITSAIVHGDSFHRYDRDEMKRVYEEAGENAPSHFGPEANLFGELEDLFAEYGRSGTGKVRQYVHDDEEAQLYGRPPGTFTPWLDLPAGTDLLYYEGLHGAVRTDAVDVARHVDLRIGVVPIINLEWIQKLHRDRSTRGYSTEAVTDTILRRMPDYVHYICPQFSNTHINFQRVPVVDTSNPFIAGWIPTLDESMVVIRFADPRGIDFPYLLSMIDGSFMSRANSIVVPGGKMHLAMQLIFTPLIWWLVESSRKARAREGART
ncbi:phosphoribulokinase [Tessaracoccus lapidicaptus]|uniref:Phosphoribulokinase n=1 Tax=Tessaracoccus lapidicaptus TaxID=1427523 RepID=A0A1C0ARX3_9ACTN|nr:MULTISPECIES: phosphoribulokinase [Tessaracoccus]AQX15854.1 phosphoribulokinase [Tessaracoccus sp. T2.5-30]OCL37126.1 phosphoribulokinase [Tessaracoccus lapidicaptus]VEP40309.1 Phosphoribulokinase, plasmid [Tessaracoccus lapidicaptus]